MSALYPLDKYRRELAEADWFYEYAEGECYQLGLQEMARLKLIAKQSEEHLAAFRAAFDQSRGK